MRGYLRAVEFDILRNVPVSPRKSVVLSRKPARIATILHENRLVASGHIMEHMKTVFLEDRIHDWQWENGLLRYYTRIASEAADIIVAYTTEVITPTAEQIMALSGTKANFDPMTGERMQPPAS